LATGCCCCCWSCASGSCGFKLAPLLSIHESAAEFEQGQHILPIWPSSAAFRSCRPPRVRCDCE
jgi:hypothetical protein